MEFLSIITQNLLSPALLFFALGIIAGAVKSDLAVPESISRYLSIYLMMAIGFKGGAAIAGTDSVSITLLLVLVAGVAMSFLQPFAAVGLLRATTRLDATTQAAIAGHYGSVSIVTFVTAISFLGQAGVSHESYIVAVLALYRPRGLRIARVELSEGRLGHWSAP